MAKLKMFEVDRENDYKKCGCCNWEVRKVYLVAETQEEADKLFAESGIEDGEPRHFAATACAKC